MKTEEKEYYENKLIEAKQIASDAGSSAIEYVIAVFEKIALNLKDLREEN